MTTTFMSGVLGSLVAGIILLAISPTVINLLSLAKKNPFNTFVLIGLCISAGCGIKIAFFQA